MKVLAVISARGGSKEVPRKNLRKLANVSLVEHMFRKASACNLIDRVICSTDDQEIASIAKMCNVEVPFNRPVELANDRAPLVMVTQHAMHAMDELGYEADIIVQLSPTCPFIRIDSIKESIEYVMKNDCECAVSLKKIEHEHPYRARVLGKNNYFKNFIQDVDVEAERYHSRQDLPVLYCTSGGIYARKRHLLENFDGSDFTMGTLRKGVILDDIESINIGRMLDLHFAQFLVKENIAKAHIFV